jgi:hypothetical protein
MKEVEIGNVPAQYEGLARKHLILEWEFVMSVMPCFFIFFNNNDL